MKLPDRPYYETYKTLIRFFVYFVKPHETTAILFQALLFLTLLGSMRNVNLLKVY
jgi:hypothetical protein